MPGAADIVRQEIFSPVAPIVIWRDRDELLTLVNDSEMGLAAYVFAGNLQYTMQLGESIEAGMVGINRDIISDPPHPSAPSSEVG